MAGLIAVKSHAGQSYVQPANVVAIVHAPTGGGSLILLDNGGPPVVSIETPSAIAGRFKKAGV